MPREASIPAKTVLEEINSIYEARGLVRVMVGTGRMVDDVFEFDIPQQFVTYEILGDDYAELMSADPAWAPGKPAGTYRNEDLWQFIDRLRSPANA